MLLSQHILQFSTINNQINMYNFTDKSGADPAKNLTVADLSSLNSCGEGSPPPGKIFEIHCRKTPFTAF